MMICPFKTKLLIILFHLPILLKEAATLQWTFQDKAVVTNARGNGKYNQNCCYKRDRSKSVRFDPNVF
jgi:hypothetical protein